MDTAVQYGVGSKVVARSDHNVNGTNVISGVVGQVKEVKGNRLKVLWCLGTVTGGSGYEEESNVSVKTVRPDGSGCC